jgi:hypothetical protein
LSRIQLTTRPYFIWKNLCTGRQPFDRTKLNQFEKYLNKSKIPLCRLRPGPACSPLISQLTHRTEPTTRHVAAHPSRHPCHLCRRHRWPLTRSGHPLLTAPPLSRAPRHRAAPRETEPEPPECRILTKHRRKLPRFRRWALSFSSALSCASLLLLDASISIESEIPAASLCRAMESRCASRVSTPTSSSCVIRRCRTPP